MFLTLDLPNTTQDFVICFFLEWSAFFLAIVQVFVCFSISSSLNLINSIIPYCAANKSSYSVRFWQRLFHIFGGMSVITCRGYNIDSVFVSANRIKDFQDFHKLEFCFLYYIYQKACQS